MDADGGFNSSLHYLRASASICGSQFIFFYIVKVWHGALATLSSTALFGGSFLG